MRLPDRRVTYQDFGEYTVPSGQTVRPAMPVVLNATDGNGSEDYPNAQEATADTHIAIGIARGNPGATAYAAGARFEATHLFTSVEWVRAGTGTVTRGARVVSTTDGVIDAPANGNGTTAVHSPGVALTGSTIAGTTIALAIMPSAINKT